MFDGPENRRIYVSHYLISDEYVDLTRKGAGSLAVVDQLLKLALEAPAPHVAGANHDDVRLHPPNKLVELGLILGLGNRVRRKER